MAYIIEIEHEWNKQKKGFLSHSDALGDIFATNKNDATFFLNLSEVEEKLKSMDNNHLISIEYGDFIVTSILEIELTKKRKIKIEEL